MSTPRSLASYKVENDSVIISINPETVHMIWISKEILFLGNVRTSRCIKEPFMEKHNCRGSHSSNNYHRKSERNHNIPTIKQTNESYDFECVVPFFIEFGFEFRGSLDSLIKTLRAKEPVCFSSYSTIITHWIFSNCPKIAGITKNIGGKDELLVFSKGTRYGLAQLNYE